MNPSNNCVDVQPLTSGSGSSENNTASSSSSGSSTDGGTDRDGGSSSDTQSLKGNDLTDNSSESKQAQCSGSTSDIPGGECFSSSVTQGNKRKRKTSSRKSLLAKMLSFEDELSTEESCGDEGERLADNVTTKLPGDITESSPLPKSGSEEFVTANAGEEDGSDEELWEKCLMSALSLFEDYGDIVSTSDNSETFSESSVVCSLGNSNRKTEREREFVKDNIQREDAFNSNKKTEDERVVVVESVYEEGVFQ